MPPLSSIPFFPRIFIAMGFRSDPYDPCPEFRRPLAEACAHGEGDGIQKEPFHILLGLGFGPPGHPERAASQSSALTNRESSVNWTTRLAPSLPVRDWWWYSDGQAQGIAPCLDRRVYSGGRYGSFAPAAGTIQNVNRYGRT